MKTIIHSSILLALASSGIAFGAATATTIPVGYETLALASGFNYVGLRLQETPAIAGTFETITTTTLVDTGVNIQAVLTATSTYLVEIVSGTGVGAVAEILGSNVANDTITVTHNFGSLGVTAGDQYVIRPASTIASVFGANNSAGLKAGSFGPTGADIIFVPTGGGNFDQYYYDADDGPGWFKNVSPSPIPVNPSLVPLVYLDSMIINSAGGGATSMVVDGEVKTKAVYHSVEALQFNYIGSIYPVGATLATAFGDPATILTLHKGSFGPTGADIIFVPTGSGNFDQYYYDADDGPGWFKNVSPSPLPQDPAAVALPSGLIFSNAGAAYNLKDSPPTFYSNL